MCYDLETAVTHDVTVTDRQTDRQTSKERGNEGANEKGADN